jgi:hypothetical protein
LLHPKQSDRRRCFRSSDPSASRPHRSFAAVFPSSWLPSSIYLVALSQHTWITVNGKPFSASSFKPGPDPGDLSLPAGTFTATFQPSATTTSTETADARR